MYSSTFVSHCVSFVETGKYTETPPVNRRLSSKMRQLRDRTCHSQAPATFPLYLLCPAAVTPLANTFANSLATRPKRYELCCSSNDETRR